MKYFVALVCLIGVCFIHLSSLSPELTYTPIVGGVFVGGSIGYLMYLSLTRGKR